MTDERAAASLLGGVGLLERAINYTLGNLRLVTPDALPRRTPCRAWDLRALLAHLDDSLVALSEAAETGGIGLGTHGTDAASPDDPVADVRAHARRLLGAWVAAGRHDPVVIGGASLTSGIVTGTGAIEIAVHGWDVARACGHERPVPPALAEEMLPLCPLFVSEADRPARFAAPVDVSALAGPADRLLAFLGRVP